ncbi:MFS transporter [Paenarthrobacter nicotinovorans]|uniref:MFS transporter n=1 Tax=Paenarthrobacter nicotinovorans TaxID=29320 RepID=UPI003748497D
MGTLGNHPPAPAEGAHSLASGGTAEDAVHVQVSTPPPADSLPPVSKGFILLLVLGLFGTYIAFVTPIAISLAIQVNALSPGNPEYLGILLSIGSLAALLVGPLFGQLSDRTRSRFGRRRPWLIGGMIVGLIGLTVMGLAQSILILGVGWVIAQIGLSQAANLFGAVQADRVPEFQRGKVAGLTGFATMVAPVIGSVMGGTVAGRPLLLFLIPGAVMVVFVLLFAFRFKDSDSRNLILTPLTGATVLSKYVFNPRRYPDFSWNWLGRFLFFSALTLNTTYTAYFFSSRLDIPVESIGGTVALIGGIGILGTMGGAIGSGFISDKLRRRKVFVLGAALLFAISAVVLILAPSLPVLIVGSFLGNLAIGIFSAVDQALFLDVLPERETEAARFINLTQFATTIPQAVAPGLAAGLLTIGVAEGTDPNYGIVYIAAAVLAVLGGLVVLRVKSVR